MNGTKRVPSLLHVVLVVSAIICTPIAGRSATPTITSLSPTSAAVGASVTITGTNYGSTQGTSTVKFNGTTATSITSWSSTSIVAVVPSGATTGNVVVTVSGSSSSGKSFTVLATPTLTSLSPTSGAVGASVTLTGTNFGSTQGTGTVKFNGTAATSITSWSSTSIVAVVPTGATTGNVVVTASGVNTSGVSFTVLATPTLTSLSPTSGAVGASVTLTGTNFGSTQGTGTVKFNGTAATSITSWSSTSIIAVVPTGATTGNAVVTASGVTTSGVSFTVLATPTLTSLSPTSGAVGASVTLTGTNFGSTQGTGTVKFNGTAATSITSWSSTSIVAVVPAGATTGNVVVTASGVTTSGVSFTVLPTPTLSSLSPTSAAVGASVTLTGTNFGSTQGTGTVKFNGTAATSFTSWSSTSIVAVVPTGATTGNVVVTASGVTTSGVSFTVLATPTLTSLSPTSGAVGASVTLTGTNFGSTQGTSTVTFNGIAATSITSWSSTSIVAVVPTGATTGNVVVTASGVATSGKSFTVLATPTLISLSPTSGAVGTSVTLTGTNFGSAQGTGTVTFNGTAATSITSWSSSSIVAKVPTGATTGNVVVIASGVATSGVSFTVLPTPTITSLSPTSGAVSASVTISGTNFGSTQGTSTVTFNGTAATSITSWSGTSIVAVVPTGATTGNVVVTVSGVASSGSSFTVLATPTLTSLSPTSGAVGTSVTLTGTNFGSSRGTGGVTFNGTAATSITTWSSTSIVAVVPTGATTGNVVVTASGVATNGKSFTVLPSAPTPTFSPAAGSYPYGNGGTAVTVTISDSNSGATIYYTLGNPGTTPTTSSAVYTGPIGISQNETLEAIAVVSGYANSPVATGAYTIQALAPTFTLVAGSYVGSQTLTMADAMGSSVNIYYTTNGTTPTTSSTRYTSAITVSSTETVQAIAASSGYSSSPVESATYTITSAVATPTFSPVAGSYPGARVVTINDSSLNSTIYYTITSGITGTTPTTSSTAYTGGITVSSTETLEAIAAVTGYTPSPAATATYTLSAIETSTTALAVTSGGSFVTSVASGSLVTLTATVASGATAVTTGTVNFCDASATYCTDIHVIGTAQLTSGGTAAVNILPGIGSRSYKAIFVGTSSYEASSSSTTQLTVIAKSSYPTVTTISQSPSTVGNYTLSAQVAGMGSTSIAPTGTVSIVDTSNANAVLGTGLLSYGYSGIAFANAPTVSIPETVYGDYNLVAVGDFNGDGNQDMAVMNGNLVTILLSNGNGAFTQANGSPIAVDGGFVAAGDFNGDGKQDLAVLSPYGNLTTLLGNGDGTFTVGNPTASLCQGPTSLATSDFNRDGKLDLAIACATTLFGGPHAVIILLGNGDGTFTQSNGSPISDNYSPTFIAVGDFNGDGVPDLAVTDWQGYVTILLGNGDGTFAQASGSPITINSEEIESVAVGDFNGDGKPDLAVVTYYYPEVFIFLGNGDGTFTAGNEARVGNGPVSVAVGDFNQDGIPDLAVVNNHDNTVSILMGWGNATFGTYVSPIIVGNEPQSVAVGDFYGNGIPDVAVVNFNNPSSVNILQTNLSENSSVLFTGIAPLGAGTHNVEAVYGGDVNFTASTSTTIPLQTIPNGMSASLVPMESVFGNPVTVNVALMPQNGAVPTGTVSCSGAGVVSSPVGVNINGSATVQMNGLPIGRDSIVCLFTSSNQSVFSNTGSSPVMESVVAAPDNGSVSITPTSATIYAGQLQQFSASVFNTTNQAVSWTVSPSGAGTIDAAGLYTAPTTVTSPQTIAITAISLANTAQSASVMITLSPPQCASSGYSYQRTIVIDHTKIPNTDQADFPFLFNTTDPALATTANGGHVTNSNGYDIIFSTDPGGLTKLDHELEEYNPATGQVIAWVRVPTLSHTTDTVLYVFYGNQNVSASQQNPSGVWDSNYTGVYHLANVAIGTAADSTANGNNAALTAVSAGSGEIDGAASFNGASSFIQIPAVDFQSYPTSGSTTTGFSASFGTWFKSASAGVILGQTDGTAPGGNPSGWQPALYIDTAGRLRASVFSHGTSADQVVTAASYNDNYWHFAVDTYTNGTEELYVDGQLAGSQQVAELGYNSTYTYFAGTGETADSLAGNGSWLYFNGALDEVNVSNVARSGDWVQTEYSNQSSPSTFYTLYPENAEEVVPAAVSLSASQSQQLTVLGSVPGSCSAPTVTWSLPSGLPGTITPSGLYTAPNSIDTQQAVTITGTTLGDSTQSVSATVTLVPAVTVSMTPTTAILNSNQTQQFTATVSNTSNAAVTWTIDPQGAGSFNAGGLYTAPGNVTSQEVVVITATSQANPNQAASATITLSPTPPNPPSGTQCGSSGYSYQRTVVIDHTKVPNTDQADFPFLFNTTDPSLATVANGGQVTSSSGYDIIFSTDPNGLSKLDHELEEYNPVTGQVVAWVRIPTLSHTTDTVLYVFYGNSSIVASQQNPTGVWENNYQAVYHLANVGAGAVSDSTALANNGTPVSVSQSSGVIDGAASLNGASSFMQIPESDFPNFPTGVYNDQGLPITTDTTSFSASVGVWFKTASAGGILGQSPDPDCSWFFVCSPNYSPQPGDYDPPGWSAMLYVDDNGSLRGGGVVSTAAYNDNNWHFAVVTYAANGDDLLYVDGQNVGSAQQQIPVGYAPNYVYFLGTAYTFLGPEGNWNWLYFNGSIDEVTISNSPRSGDWVQTEYNNQGSPSTFYTFGSATVVQAAPPAVSLYASQNQQFAVTGTCNAAVTWSMPSGTQGTLTSSGLYIAPGSIAATQTITITATSQATGTAIASSSVTLLPPPTPIILAAAAQSPYTTGSSQAFTVTLQDQDGSPEIDVPVTFTVVGTNSNIGSGTTSSNGVATYTYAGANSGTDTIQATARVSGQLFTSNNVSATWITPSPNPAGNVTLVAPPALGLGGLIGAFTDSDGNVIEPISIGGTRKAFVVPAGATQLQLGVNDNRFGADGGSGFVVLVNGVSVTVPPTALPWNWVAGGLNSNYQYGPSGGLNANYLYGLNDGTSPVVATTGLSAGESVIAAYQSGTASANFPVGALVNANGDPANITGGQILQGTYFPTLYTTASSYPVGQPITFNALVTDDSGAPIPNAPVTLNVQGAHPGQYQATTDSTGTATFMYSGSSAGTDSLQAQAETGLVSNLTSVTWVGYATPPPGAPLQLALFGYVNNLQDYTVLVTDASGNPVANASVGLYVWGVDNIQLSATTDSTGNAEFAYNHVNLGTYNLMAVDSVDRSPIFSNIISGQWPSPSTSSGSGSTINISISAQNTVYLPNTMQLNGTVIDNIGFAPSVVWSQVSGPGTVTFANPLLANTTASFNQTGIYVIELSASDSISSASAQFQVTVNPPPVQALQQGWVGSPIYGSAVSGIVPITVTPGVTLQSGTLTVYPANSPLSVTTLNANTTGSGQIGVLDTTVLPNGSYRIQLQATDTGGQSQYSLVQVTVSGNYKPGRVTATVTDLVVPVTGLPINIQRTYDSLNAGTSSDFGYGWSLGLNVNLTVDPAGDVTFTLGGQRRTFYFTPQAPSGTLIGPVFNYYLPAYTPEPGLTGTLSDGGTGCGNGLDLLNAEGSAAFCSGTGAQYDPSEYIYTDANGTAYTIGTNGMSGTLQAVQDRSGNALNIGPNGITSANGLSVPFVRDANNRITQITDPQGNIYSYTYDASGNLASVTYPNTSQPSTYTYDTNHLYLSGIDARGNPLPVTTYFGPTDTDPNGLPLNGRLESESDALGETTGYAYNLATNTTTVTYPADASGNVGTATMVYDSYGMLLSNTDPLNNTTTNAYDANHNLISTTDPLGKTTTYTYDSNGNRTSSTYPATATSTNTTSYATFNQYSEQTSATDELGNVRTYNYDAYYNPQSVTDSIGVVASFLFSQNSCCKPGQLAMI
jgi:YD repeat-containing protein